MINNRGRTKPSRIAPDWFKRYQATYTLHGHINAIWEYYRRLKSQLITILCNTGGAFNQINECGHKRPWLFAIPYIYLYTQNYWRIRPDLIQYTHQQARNERCIARMQINQQLRWSEVGIRRFRLSQHGLCKLSPLIRAGCPNKSPRSGFSSKNAVFFWSNPSTDLKIAALISFTSVLTLR